jgi:glycosyltransferase involved in cell wall biosynthesis
MRLSFVVPTLNQAPFIRRCIDGCLDQEIADSEVVVVDGGSTDGTQGILATYGDRVRWVSEPDRGQSDAINKGIRMARGDVVAWVNSDDYYPRGDVLRTVLASFEADPQLDVAYGDGELVDASYVRIRILRAQRPLDARRILLFAGAPVSQPSVFFRRALFLQVGGVDEGLHWTMDYDLWIRMFERARRTAYVPGVLSCTTSHAGAKTVRGMLRQIHEVGRVKRRHMARFRLSPLEKAQMAAGWASMYAYWAATRLGLKRAA